MGHRVMSQMIGPFRRFLLALAVAAAALAPLVLPPTAVAESVERGGTASGFSLSNQPCLTCHGQADLAMTLDSGEKLSVFVDEEAMGGSVHAGKLVCSDCHSRITGYPHRKLQVSTRRDYSASQYEACKRCHFANYTQTLDSIHYQTLEAGDKAAPLCTDCHGYHEVTRPDEPRGKILKSCGGCHRGVSDAYRGSVHGAALERESNGDVPTCIDCHGTHRIRDASTGAFRLDSPEMCARCHADPERMARYGLSPNVFKTYLQDFHGTTVALTKRHDRNDWTAEAVCSDCHGVHDIKPVKQGNAAELKRNIATTCQKCHPDAGANFPDAWLSHYELSPGKALLPWLVRTSYAMFIPFMVTGLTLHVLVDLWRIARNR